MGTEFFRTNSTHRCVLRKFSQMPKYRFEFVDEPEADPVYVELDNDEAARDEARRALAEGMLDKLIEMQRSVDPSTNIYNEAGYLIATVKLSEATAEGDEDGVLRASLKVSRQ